MTSGSSAPAGGRFAQYELLSLLGSGGMGDVYLARDTRLQRRVALKLLRAPLDSEHAGVDRFLREARAIANLDHPAICTLYEVGRDHDRDFLVMQYVEGETVAARLKRGRLPLDEALRIAVELTTALVYAHGQGVLHRDIKPQNVIVQPDGRVKLLDFGLAKFAGPPDVRTHAETEALLTRDGTLMGTLEYMSPEQMGGRVVDARSDVFSLALVIYELVGGAHPFRGNTAALTVSAILTRPYPPLTDGRVPAALNTILEKALAPEPAMRHATAADVLVDLERVRQSIGRGEPAVPAGPAAANRPRAWWFAGAAALVLALVVAAVALWPPGSAERPSARPSPAVVPAADIQSIRYWFDVMPVKNGRPQPVYRSVGDDRFADGWKFRITLTSAVPAFVYLVDDDGDDLSLVYPLAPADSAQRLPPAATHESDWFGFSGAKADERLWIVWSLNRVASLDPLIPLANSRDLGRVGDPRQAVSIREWLAANEPRDVVESRGPNPPMVSLQSARPLLVRRITLQHEARAPRQQ